MSEYKQIKILKHTMCGGKAVRPGDVVDAMLGDARYLVNTGAAEPFVEAEKPKRKNKMIDTQEMEVRDLGE